MIAQDGYLFAKMKAWKEVTIQAQNNTLGMNFIHKLIEFIAILRIFSVIIESFHLFPDCVKMGQCDLLCNFYK